MANENVIFLDMTDDPALTKEAVISGTPKPGMLMEKTSAATDTIQAHSTAGGVADGMFLLENTARAGLIDTAYTAAERGRYRYAKRGERINAWLVDEGDVSKGDLLVSDGAGALKAKTTEVNFGTVVARADEDKDNTGGSGIVRIKVIAL